jgi:hypothetical protein
MLLSAIKSFPTMDCLFISKLNSYNPLMTACAVFEMLKRSFHPIPLISGVPGCRAGASRVQEPKRKEKNLDELYQISAGNRVGTTCVYPASVNTVAHVVVAIHARLDLIAFAPKGWRLHRESPPILDCFHGHFCLGAAVVDPRHGDCQKPWLTSISSKLA